MFKSLQLCDYTAKVFFQEKEPAWSKRTALRASLSWEGGTTGQGLRSGEIYVFWLAGKMRKHMQKEWFPLLPMAEQELLKADQEHERGTGKKEEAAGWKSPEP